MTNTLIEIKTKELQELIEWVKANEMTAPAVAIRAVEIRQMDILQQIHQLRNE